MFARWLINIFPTELRHSWRLVQRDLPLWIALASLLSVAVVAMPDPKEGFSPVTLITLVAAVLTTSLPPLLFRAAAQGLTLDWKQVLTVIAARFLPLTAYSVIAILLAQSASSIVRVAVLALTKGAPFGEPLSLTLATIVLATFFLQFLFMPYFVLLHSREEIPESLWGLGPSWFGGFVWPLTASARLGDGIRWKVLPYMVISRATPLVALLVPPSLLLVVMIGSQVLSLWAMAVVFDYYRLRAAAHGFEAASDDWPAVGFGKRPS